MSENKEPLGNIREQLTVKTAECNASNAKVGTLMGQLLDAETKIIVLNDIIANNNGKGTRVIGQNSGIVATIKNFVLPPEEGVDDTTIFIKYNQ